MYANPPSTPSPTPATSSPDFLSLDPAALVNAARQLRDAAEQLAPAPLPEPPPELPVLHPAVAEFLRAAEAALTTHHLRLTRAAAWWDQSATELIAVAEGAVAADDAAARQLGGVR